MITAGIALHTASSSVREPRCSRLHSFIRVHKMYNFCSKQLPAEEACSTETPACHGIPLPVLLLGLSWLQTAFTSAQPLCTYLVLLLQPGEDISCLPIAAQAIQQLGLQLRPGHSLLRLRDLPQAVQGLLQLASPVQRICLQEQRRQRELIPCALSHSCTADVPAG